MRAEAKETLRREPKNRRATRIDEQGGGIKRLENGQKEMRTIQNIIIGTEVRTN